MERTTLENLWLEDEVPFPLLFNVIEIAGSAPSSLEFSGLLVLALMAPSELEAEPTILMSLLLSPASFMINLRPSGLNTGGRLITAPFTLVDVEFLFLLLLSLDSELELEIGLGCLFVAGSRATVGLGTETSADDALVWLFWRF